MNRLLPATLAVALLLAGPLGAAPPPAGSMPASDILRQAEQRPDFSHLDEMEWDDDGYWEVEYVTRTGSKVKLRLDPRTGQPVSR
jgi:hypothetical protein